MSIKDAMTVLKAHNFVGEIITLSSNFHHGFLLRVVGGGSNVAADESLGYCAFLLSALQTSLNEFEALLHSDAALAVEHQGIRLCASPVALMRGWRDGVAAFAGRSLSTLLAAWSQLLLDKTNEVKSKTPSWQVAIVDNCFQLQLAMKVLSNRLPIVARAHNELHGLLQANSVLGPLPMTGIASATWESAPTHFWGECLDPHAQPLIGLAKNEVHPYGRRVWGWGGREGCVFVGGGQRSSAS